MKQHISLSDLNQLSDKGKERLWEWDLKTKTIEANKFGAIYTQWRTDENLPLLSIGQLIQFLDEHEFFVDFVLKQFHPQNCWVVRYMWFDKEKEFVAEELCDSLWMAVKDILEKEDK